MSGKNERAMRKMAALTKLPAPPLTRTVVGRFHPVRNLMLCRSKMESVSAGGIHLPGNRAIAIPIGYTCSRRSAISTPPQPMKMADEYRLVTGGRPER